MKNFVLSQIILQYSARGRPSVRNLAVFTHRGPDYWNILFTSVKGVYSMKVISNNCPFIGLSVTLNVLKLRYPILR